jgi:endonuclease/exonuclease/phosphatase family metal-dependent hydrolase
VALTRPLPAAAQVTVVLDAPGTEAVDTTIQGGSYAATNFATEPLVTRSSSDPSFLRRALLKFDTETRIPLGARITSALLTVTVKEANDSTRSVAAYRITQAFDENAATWNDRRPSLEWASAGGDLGAKYAEADVAATLGAKVKFDLTTLVQAVVNGNYGSRYTRVALVDVGGTDAERATYREYYQSEATDPAVRPRLTVTYTTAGGSPEEQEPPPPAPSGATLRVLHWNTHHGRGTDGEYDIERIATWIAKMNPDVVSLNEVERFSGAHGNEDQPARYASLLKAKTGRTWHYYFLDAQGGASGGGSAILSRFPITGHSECVLPSSNNAVHAALDVNGRTVNVWSVHMPPGRSSSAERTRHARALLSCAKEFSENRVLAGDWNSTARHPEVQAVLDTYQDSWAVAKTNGDAIDFPGNSQDGGTFNYRIDYVFYSKNARLRLEKAQVFDTRGSDGARASDHKPLVATFSLY